MNKFYKVVRVDRETGKRYSAFVGVGVNRRKYFTNRFTSPEKGMDKKGYWLACFDNKDCAISFVTNKVHPRKYRDELEIWEIEVKNIKRKIPPGYPFVIVSGGFFKNKMFKKYPPKANCWFPNTVMAQKVKLIKKIYPQGESNE